MITNSPGHPVVLFDGHCRFCTRSMKKLTRLVPRAGIEEVNFQETGALDRFPGVTWELCMKALVLVTAGGRVYTGAEGVVRTLGLRRLGKLTYIYYVPGLRWVFDKLYALIARNRYRLMGKCEGGTCALHVPKRG